MSQLRRRVLPMKPTSGTQFMRISVALAFLWAGLLPLVAQSQLALYDNFNAKQINPSKWAGQQFYDPDTREAVRELTGEDRDRRLHLSQTAYSATTDDNGSS